MTLLDGAVNLNAPVVVVESLLKHRADPNARDLNSNAPLHYAARGLPSESGKKTELLLDHRADPNVRNYNGETPLDCIKERLAQSNLDSAVKASLNEVAALLRSHGALDNLPHWIASSSAVPRPIFSRTVFRAETNDWNRFTLLETILNLNYYEWQGRNSVPPFPPAPTLMARPLARCHS